MHCPLGGSQLRGVESFFNHDGHNKEYKNLLLDNKCKIHKYYEVNFTECYLFRWFGSAILKAWVLGSNKILNFLLRM